MSPSLNLKKYGRLQTSIYTFAKTGDVLPMHSHTPENVHISIVARGACKMSGPAFEDIIVHPGTIVDWEPGTEHEFTALADDTVLINIVKS